MELTAFGLRVLGYIGGAFLQLCSLRVGLFRSFFCLSKLSRHGFELCVAFRSFCLCLIYLLLGLLKLGRQFDSLRLFCAQLRLGCTKLLPQFLNIGVRLTQAVLKLCTLSVGCIEFYFQVGDNSRGASNLSSLQTTGSQPRTRPISGVSNLSCAVFLHAVAAFHEALRVETTVFAARVGRELWRSATMKRV